MKITITGGGKATDVTQYVTTVTGTETINRVPEH